MTTPSYPSAESFSSLPILSDLNTTFEALLTSPEELNENDLVFWLKVVEALKAANWVYEPKKQIFIFNEGFPEVQVSIAYHSMQGHFIEFKVTYINEDFTSEIETFNSAFNQEQYNLTFVELVKWVQSKRSKEDSQFNRKEI